MVLRNVCGLMSEMAISKSVLGTTSPPHTPRGPFPGKTTASEYHLFGPLKRPLSEKRFYTDDASCCCRGGRMATINRLTAHSSMREGIYELLHRWDKRIMQSRWRLCGKVVATVVTLSFKVLSTLH